MANSPGVFADLGSDVGVEGMVSASRNSSRYFHWGRDSFPNNEAA